MDRNRRSRLHSRLHLFAVHDLQITQSAINATNNVNIMKRKFKRKGTWDRRNVLFLGSCAPFLIFLTKKYLIFFHKIFHHFLSFRLFTFMLHCTQNFLINKKYLIFFHKIFHHFLSFRLFTFMLHCTQNFLIKKKKEQEILYLISR